MQFRLLPVLFLCLTITAPAYAADRSVSVNPRNVDTQRKIALVIGNSAYHISPLKNPANDAVIMAKTLRELGFNVDERTNLGQNGMKEAIEAFGRKIKQGGVGLFYYAGHGMQVNGRNYLIPVDADIQGESEVDYKAVDAGLVLAKMDMAHNAMNIVILDACRNNPFTRSFRSTNPGLASMNAPSGTFIAYATAPGSVASDGAGANGLFTEELTKAIKKPGLKIEDAFKLVNAGVQKQTQGKQIPWVAMNIVGDFYFSGSGGVDRSKLDSLAEGSKERQAELERLKKLEAAAAQQKEKEQAEIAQKERALVALDAQIASMKSRLGTVDAGNNNSLERMVALVEKKEADARKLEELRQQREAEEAKRQADIELLRKKAEEKRIAQIKKDIANYEKIVNSPYGKDMMSAAWKNLVSKYASVEGIEQIEVGNIYELRFKLTGKYETTDPETGMEFIVVKGGCYQMGDTFGDGISNEKPAHEVCVDDFYIGKYEVTQAQWSAIRGSNPSNFSNCGGNCPVEQVSWNDVQDYIRILNQRTGKTYRLPTEAEWEYAARSGGKSEKYAGGNDPDSVAWYSENSENKTHLVGQKQPNGLGLYDMSGNVWEWVEDVYNESAYSSHSRNNPIYIGSGSRRVNRGGSWYSIPRSVRAANRGYYTPDFRGDSLGFRLSRTP